MSGIVFFRSGDLSDLRGFYTARVGADVWKDQGDCIILDGGGFRFAFCEREGAPDTCGVLTFLYDSVGEVDEMYEQLQDVATSKPVSREPDYSIYQFYAEDPEGRKLEFQTFLDD